MLKLACMRWLSSKDITMVKRIETYPALWELVHFGHGKLMQSLMTAIITLLIQMQRANMGFIPRVPPDSTLNRHNGII